ncbi:MAG TPA: hypothetical protein VF665_18365 [Longimicrobium sp.]|uniref:HAAS signaling domain-containing protein n=1 Tax=Longimicrobium sp. TaxID=2029185 RepID=UPI002EDB45D9
MIPNHPERDAALEQYLSRLEAELSTLPEPERRDILLEMRSHVLDGTRRPPARTVTQVLAELGPAQVYARQFLAPRTEWPRPGLIARLAGRRWMGVVLLLPVVAAYSVAVFAVLLAVNKMLEPANTGLWMHDPGEPFQLQLVASDPGPRAGREVLGMWLVPMMLALALGVHLAVRAVLRRLLRPR